MNVSVFESVSAYVCVCVCACFYLRMCVHIRVRVSTCVQVSSMWNMPTGVLYFDLTQSYIPVLEINVLHYCAGVGLSVLNCAAGDSSGSTDAPQAQQSHQTRTSAFIFRNTVAGVGGDTRASTTFALFTIDQPTFRHRRLTASALSMGSLRNRNLDARNRRLTHGKSAQLLAAEPAFRQNMNVGKDRFNMRERFASCLELSGWAVRHQVPWRWKGTRYRVRSFLGPSNHVSHPFFIHQTCPAYSICS